MTAVCDPAMERTASVGLERALTAVAAGEAVVVGDEKGGNLVAAAALATPETVALLLRLGSGIVSVAAPAGHFDALAPRSAPGGLASFDLAGRGDAGSAAGRAATIAALADPGRGREDFSTPGSVLVHRVAELGLIARAGVAEAAADLVAAAGLGAAAFCEIASADKLAPAAAPEVVEVARAEGLESVDAGDLLEHRLATERLLEHAVATHLPTVHGDFVCHGWRSRLDGAELIALVPFEPTGAGPIHVHRRCGFGDTFAARGCGCYERLVAALEEIGRERRGVLVYLSPAGAAERWQPCRPVEPGEALDPATAASVAQMLADIGDGSLR